MLLSVTDYVAQAVLALLVFIYPWFVRPGRGWQTFAFPFVLIFIWSIWRVLYFDAATRNDVPGGFYFAGAFAYSVVSLSLYGIRCLIGSYRSRRHPPGRA